MLKSLSSLSLGTDLFRLEEEAFLLLGFALLSRYSTTMVHDLLVMPRDSFVDFKGKLFTSLVSLLKLILNSRGVSFLAVRLKAELNSLVVADDFLLS
jgi:hypothetical protein